MARSLTQRIRAAAVEFMRSGYEAAGTSGRWPASATLPMPVTQSLAAAGPIAAKAFSQSVNNPTAASFVECWVSGVGAGLGPTARSQHPDETIRRDLDQRFVRFAKSCDLEGGTLAMLVDNVLRSMILSGDGFVQMIINKRKLTFKLVNSEQIARAWTRVLPNGERIFSGVEVDDAGMSKALWTYKYPLDLPWAFVQMPERHAIEDWCHCFRRDFPGQLRGVSWLAPIATTLMETDRIQDALAARMRVAALFAGFIRDADGASGFAEQANARGELSLEPGILRFLPVGTDITFPDLPNIEGAPELLRHMLRMVASGGGVPVALLTGDHSEANYSSLRHALEGFKRSVERVRGLMVAQLLQPLFERWLMVEILSGRLAAPDFEAAQDDYHAVDWRWPAWASLDPLKDAEADALLLANKVKSRSEIIAERGGDIEIVDAEIGRDQYATEPVQTTARPQPQQENANVEN